MGRPTVDWIRLFLAFFLAAILAHLFGFTAIGGLSADAAKVCLLIGAVLFVASLVLKKK